jgi:hypothetical protein
MEQNILLNNDLTTESSSKLDNQYLKCNEDTFFLDIEKDTKLNKEDLLKKIEPIIKLGNLYSFFYKDGDPIIVIGPHCKSI